MHKLQIAFLSAFFFVLTANAQIKPGFKWLNAKNYPKAAVKLQAALSNPEDAPVAQLGLLRIREATQPFASFEEVRTAYREISASYSAYLELPKERRQYLSAEKRIRVKDTDFKAAQKRLQQQAIEYVEAELSLELLDSLMLTMGPVHSGLLGQLEELERILVIGSFLSEDYRTLRSVFKYHRHILEKNGFNPESHKVSFWLLDAFLREHPLHAFPGFVADFPWHWASRDCYIEPFVQAVTERGSAPLLSFLAKHPDSNLDNVVVHALDFPQNKYLSGSGDPGMKDLLVVSSIIAGYSPEDLSSNEMQAKIKKYIAAMAPSNRSYKVLIAGLQALHEKGEYAKCAELIKFAQPLFPDVLESWCTQPSDIINKRQAWFEASYKVLSAPDYPVKKTMVPSAALEGVHEFAPIISLDEKTLYFSTSQDLLPVVKYTVQSDSGWTVGVPYERFGPVQLEQMYWISTLGDAMLYKKFGKLYYKMFREEAERMDRYLGAFRWKGRAVFVPQRKSIIFEASLDSLPLENDSDIDLYVISWSGSWSAPKRLPFNTPAQERLPFMHADGKTLFFTSNGLNSLGGHDLYSVRVLSKDNWDTWDDPQNLGKEINSFNDEAEEGFSVSASGKYIYRVEPEETSGGLSSNICKVELPVHVRPTRVIVIKGSLNVIQSGMRIKAVTNVNSEMPIGESEVHPGGNFVLLLEDPGKQVVYLYADHPLFYSTFVALDLSDGKDVYDLEKTPYCTYYAEMIKYELPFPLENVHFSPGSAALSPEAKIELDWLAMNLKQRKQTLLIAGHGEPSDAKNLDSLSLERAEVVKAYLIGQGMPWDRLWTMGFADKKPVGSPRPEVGPPVDKRVEVYFKTK